MSLEDEIRDLSPEATFEALQGLAFATAPFTAKLMHAAIAEGREPTQEEVGDAVANDTIYMMVRAMLRQSFEQVLKQRP